MTDSQTITAEMKLAELSYIIDDLTSLANTPGGASAIRRSNIEAAERRLRYLRFDLKNQIAAE
jgi:hypothetical protein